MSEEEAKFWYKNHLVLQCDFCELIFNEHDLLDKHIAEDHKDQLEPEEATENKKVIGNEDSEDEDGIPDFDD